MENRTCANTETVNESTTPKRGRSGAETTIAGLTEMQTRRLKLIAEQKGLYDFFKDKSPIMRTSTKKRDDLSVCRARSEIVDAATT